MLRNTICLNGLWDFMPLYGVTCTLDLPEKLDFETEKISVPSSWRYSNPDNFGIIDDFQPYDLFNYPLKWREAETGVYRRTFKLDENMLQGNQFLKFNGIMQKSRIYLNGTVAGEWNESFLPLEIDVTGLVKRDGSENELMVVCTEFDKTVIPSGQTKTLGLKGSWYGNLCRGIWQDVFLESRPPIYVKDAYIKTSVRNKNITADVTIKNTTEFEHKLTVKLEISDENGIAKTFEVKDLKVAANSDITSKVAEEWANPVLWDIDNPHLYSMDITVYQNENMIIDSKTVRFGFREIWTDNEKFILNGTRINLRGDSWHFQGAVQQTKEYALNWYKMCRENGLNFVRLHAEPHPEYYLDAADEAGMLIVDETAIYGSSKSMDASHPVFLENCDQHIKRLIKRDKNHPSIIMWSIENEMRWVDGREGYKQHVPKMLKIVKELDTTRPIILEGDNRLISKENTQVESLHYNIDGTIAQWDKTRPLVFGEHGGWWYICPQNTSAYNGAKTYLSLEEARKGVVLKERLYVEYARKADVSGITSFNFAHYLMKSMPAEDILLEQGDLNTPGVKPKLIRKLSLTLNNGLLKDYPVYIPNEAMPILKESYKPVTILAAEYNSFFYAGEEILRTFDVYNDTLYTHNTKVNVTVKEKSGELIYENIYEFTQLPSERKTIEVKFTPAEITGNIREICLEAVLYHEDKEQHRLQKVYKLCPKSLKTEALNMQDKKILYIGNEKTADIIKFLVPNAIHVNTLDGSLYSYDILIIGDYIPYSADKYQSLLGDYVEKGGIVIQLEQSSFAPGDVILYKHSFFSAHISSKENAEHPILKDLKDEDFMFWKPDITEEIPASIIEQAFIKPSKGDFNMLLECNAGDFGDGGDFWTPLIEYRHNLGLMLLNQLEIGENFDTVPQACILLRNMLLYAADFAADSKANTCLLATKESTSYEFFRSTDLEFSLIDTSADKIDFKNCETLIIDPDSLTSSNIKDIQAFTENGGTTLILPCHDIHKDNLEALLQSTVAIRNAATYQLETTTDSPVTRGITITDLFRYEKIHLTPRLVENRPICTQSIEVKGAAALANNVTNTPWYDYFVRNLCAEYSRIALVEMNKQREDVCLPYVAEKLSGKGKYILSQISLDSSNEKNIRIYSRILGNLNCLINHKELFSYEKGDRDYAMDYFMTLRHEEYKDYEAAEAYYSDKNYSLNNLGEGFYGWMKKIEKDKEGFININGSRNRTYFLSCFVNKVEDKSSCLAKSDFKGLNMQIDINCSYKLWINGELLKEFHADEAGQYKATIPEIKLIKGLNRFIISAAVSEEDIKLRMVFKNSDGTYPDGLRYQLTIDEVDPK